MGAHTNYYQLILSLIRLKDELTKVTESKLQTLISILQSKEIDFTDGWEVVPTCQELAKDLDIKVVRCQGLLKQLRAKLIDSSSLNPIEITEVVHEIIISRHYEEYDGKSREIIDQEHQRSFSVEMKLPVTPRIGETIEFELADSNGYYHGTVYQIWHRVEGKRQIIQIFAHPFENAYYHWNKLKEEFKRWENLR